VKQLQDRREFTVGAIKAILAGTVITITSGCGSGSSSSSPTSPTASTAPTSPSSSSGGGEAIGSISANHGHSAVVTRVQMTASDAVQLDIRGSADHTHTVALSQGEVGQIAAGQSVSVVSASGQSSTQGNHLHTVTFNGGTPSDPSY
jgi:hypothetical protein